MNNFPVLIASLALIIASGQAWLSWNARDDHLELAALSRKMDACAEIGAAAATVAALAEQASRETRSGAVTPQTFEALKDAPRLAARASFMATYLLPESVAQDLAVMRDAAQRVVGAAPAKDRDALDRAARDITGASQRVQEVCAAEFAKADASL